ncbi:hypothetical protein V9T40_008611 [Parthenolecanium corni]|uniref:Uncharacterized protein n=1 Tax=Parthenolecanium corni TaxID=536013 RepID=A0AAN9TL67_9HEMI
MIIVDEGGEGAEQRPKSLTQIDERRRHRPRPHPHHRRKAPNDVYAYANRYFINSCVSEVCQNSSRTGDGLFSNAASITDNCVACKLWSIVLLSPSLYCYSVDEIVIPHVQPTWSKL